MDKADPIRRAMLAAPVIAIGGLLLSMSSAASVRREVEDLGLSLELPENWIPIPRAEIVEARERAVAAGASSDWTTRAAWQQTPHLRWFTLPHLTLESRPATGSPTAPPAVEYVAGRAGARTVHTYRAVWRTDALDLRLNLLSLEERRDDFERWVASIRSTRPSRP